MGHSITIDGIEYQSTQTDPEGAEYVVVRGRDSGVHVGCLGRISGDTVVLHGAARVWRWRGARTLSEMALHGVDKASKGFTRVSETVSRQVIIGACEVIFSSRDVVVGIRSAGWAE